MTGTGIRQLAIGMGAAMILAGCQAAPTGGGGGGGDPAAAALGAEAVSTTSLDGPAAPDATGAAVAPADAAVTDPTTLAMAETTPPAARKGLFGFLKAKPADTTLADDAAVAGDATAGSADPIVANPAAADPAAVTAPADAAPADTTTKPARKGLFGFLRAKPADGTSATSTPTRPSVRMVDRDVEAPDVFQVTDAGLWDGRPSLGGVWVAYSDVRDPERVIIRNTENGAFVIGALFRRERENPGPRLQISSDAADALGMLAGAPAKLNVTALRREEVVDPADSEALLGTGEPITQTPVDTVDPVTATAAAAIAAAPEPQTGDLSAAVPVVRPAAAPQPAAKPAAPGGKNFLQVGIFSVEANANNTATALKGAGLTARVIKDASQGKTFWRVIAGPAGTGAERDALLAKAKGLGFADAYFVSG